MIDLTYYRELQKGEPYRLYVFHIRLDKKTILETLQSDYIIIDGKYFEVPERELLLLLINKDYGETRLELKQIKEL